MVSNNSKVIPQKIGETTATTVVVANMVGTGVFTTLGYQLFDLRPGFPILVLWALGGLIAFCGALCYGELGGMMPRSGGEYRYLTDIYGRFTGFLAGWVSVTVGFAAPVALAAMAFGNYLVIGTRVDGERRLALGLVIVVTLIHLLPSRWAGRTQLLTTGFKLCLILGFIAAVGWFAQWQPINFRPVAGDLGQITSPPFVISLVYVMYAYSGWSAAAYIAGEIEDPKVNLPSALLAGTLIVTILYLLLNASFLLAAPAHVMTGEPKVALAAARSAFGSLGGRSTGYLVALGLFATSSGLVWAGSRVAPEMAKEHRVLAPFAWRNRFGAPWFAVLFQSAVVVLLFLTASFEPILAYIAGVLLLFSLLAVLGMMWLRIREPDRDRPFRCPLYPIPPLIFVGTTLIMLGYLLMEKPMEMFWGGVTLAIGAVVYLLGERNGE